MSITDPTVVNFVNTTETPVCEAIRSLKVRIDDAMLVWFAGITVPNDTTPLDPGSTRTGLLPLTGMDITNVITQFAAIQTLLNQSGVMAIITRPTSHPLGAQ